MDIKPIMQTRESSLYASLPAKCRAGLFFEKNAFSLCLANAETSSIIAFEHWQISHNDHAFAGQVIDVINWLIIEYPWLSSENIAFSIALDAPAYSLVPLALFEPSQKESYLAVQHPGHVSGDWIYQDSLGMMEAVLLYSLPLSLENRIKSAFPKASISHKKTVILNALLKETNEPLPLDLACVYISQSSLEFIAIHGGNLLFFNEFKWETPDDLAYFILAAMKKMSLDPAINLLKMMGAAAVDTELVLHLQQFIPAIVPKEVPANFLFDKAFGKLPKHALLPYINILT
jgi:hypothetical protein